MKNVTYCVWCGCENPAEGKTCLKCGRLLDAKENLLFDFLVERTDDKLKGKIEDSLYDAVKNYILSHLYSVVIAVAFVVTAVAAVVTALTPDPAAHIQQVTQAPVTRNEMQQQIPQETVVPTVPQQSEPEAYELTQADKTQIMDCLSGFTASMEQTRYLGGDSDFLNYIISDELEQSVGYDSYLDMYPDMVADDVYDYAYSEYGEMVIDEDTWSTQPLTQNGQELVDMGYTIVTVYADYTFYGKLTGMSDAPTVLIGSPRYLMTFTVENDQWRLMEQINVKDRLEERQDALL